MDVLSYEMLCKPWLISISNYHSSRLIAIEFVWSLVKGRFLSQPYHYNQTLHYTLSFEFFCS